MINWDDKLWLITPEEFKKLPDGFVLISILGTIAVKGKDYVDQDTRGGHLAYGASREELETVLRSVNGN